VGLLGFLGVRFVFGVLFHEVLAAWEGVLVFEFPILNILMLVVLLVWVPRDLGHRGWC
jgi:hypothetical protein